MNKPYHKLFPPFRIIGYDPAGEHGCAIVGPDETIWHTSTDYKRLDRHCRELQRAYDLGKGAKRPPSKRKRKGSRK